MLTNRIMGAFTFRREVYADVERDTTFTSTAWLLVIVVSFLNQLGAHSSRNIVSWIVGAVVGTIFVVIGFALGAFVINWVGQTVFKAKVTFEELVRTLGLAYVWNVVGFVGILAGFIPALACLLTPALFIAGLMGLIAWFVAAKEALDLEWLQVIITVVIGWVVLLVINLIAGAVLGLLGLTAAGVGGLFG